MSGWRKGDVVLLLGALAFGVRWAGLRDWLVMSEGVPEPWAAQMPMRGKKRVCT